MRESFHVDRKSYASTSLTVKDPSLENTAVTVLVMVSEFTLQNIGLGPSCPKCLFQRGLGGHSNNLLRVDPSYNATCVGGMSESDNRADSIPLKG